MKSKVSKLIQHSCTYTPSKHCRLILASQLANFTNIDIIATTCKNNNNFKRTLAI